MSAAPPARVARIREEYERTGSGTAAVAMGLERIGRMVTATAVLISIAFLAFLVSGITFVKAYGIGLPLAVLVDATVIRGALLPAAIRLGGQAMRWTQAPRVDCTRASASANRGSPPRRPLRPTPHSWPPDKWG
ncbi:MMPL family transporter [Streptomyces caelestis]|uniref:MMPL family transporter n=1 Tax=Streptomyces caelestis TaxID=36816 RepID=UPI0036F911B9